MISKIGVRLIVLSVFGFVLFNSSIASAQIRTVLVSPVPGDPIASGTALRNALAGITSPSSTNRWLVKIEPGIYQVQDTPLTMRSWVDIEGSGIGVTTIRANSTATAITTIAGASNAELRLLTVEATGGPSVGTGTVIAMLNNSGNPRVYRVKFVTQAANSEAWGMRNILAAPRIEECEFSVSGTLTNRGVGFGGFVNSGARSSILRSNIAVTGGSTNYGVFMDLAQTLVEMQDTRIDAVGGPATFGIFASPGGGWQGAETLTLRNVVINSAGGGLQSSGIWLQAGTTVGLEIYNSKIWGHVSPDTYGIFQGGNIAVGLRYSSVVGFTKTVQSAGNVGIAWTDLIGGPVTVSGWVGCIAVADEAAVFYPNTCPQ